MVDRLNSTDRLIRGDNLVSHRADETIAAGDLVKMDGTLTGTTSDVAVSDTAAEVAEYVALHGATSGEAITLAGPGCEVRVNATGTISPGDQVIASGSGDVKTNDTAQAFSPGIATSEQVGGDVVVELDGGRTGGA